MTFPEEDGGNVCLCMRIEDQKNNECNISLE